MSKHALQAHIQNFSRPNLLAKYRMAPAVTSHNMLRAQTVNTTDIMLFNITKVNT